MRDKQDMKNETLSGFKTIVDQSYLTRKATKHTSKITMRENLIIPNV